MLYAKLLHMPYNAPMEQGGTDTLPLQVNTPQHLHLQYKHFKVRHINDKHHNMDFNLTTVVLEAVNNTYIFAIHNVFMQNICSPKKEIINHLMD